MRYGENIFDQESTLIQEGILNSSLPDEDKQRLLGVHIFEELQTHAEQENQFADGGKAKPINVKDQVRDFYAAYLKSPNFEKRALATREEDPDELAAVRLKSLLNTRITQNNISTGDVTGTRYDAIKKFANVDPTEITAAKPFDLLLAHELSHATGSLGRKATVSKFLKINNREFNEFEGRMPYQIPSPDVNNMPIEQFMNYVYGTQPHEAKADMDALRFLLKRDGIYDTGTQDFNQSHLKKARLKYKDNRFLKNYKDKDIIHLMNTIASNKDMGSSFNFANGGKTKKKSTLQKAQSKYFSNNLNYSDLRSARNLYNSWAKQRGLAEIPASLEMNDETALAFANYNADPSNLRKIDLDTNPYRDPATGNTRQIVKSIGLDKFLPELDIKPLDSIVGYNKAGEAVYDDQVLPTIRDKASGKLLAVNKDYFPTAVDKTVDKGPVTNTKQVDGRVAREKSFRNESLMANLSAGATAALGGAIAASNQIPDYEPPAEYTRMRDEIYGRKNQGLSAEQMASLTQATGQNYANGINAIRNIAGGGATSGSVLASLQGLSSNMDKANLNAALLDLDVRQQNQQAYQRAVAGDLALDQQMFSADQQQAAQAQQNGLAMLSQGVQSLYDQNLYAQQYGPGTIYNDLLEAQLAGAQNYMATEQEQTAAAVAAIRAAGGGTPVVPTNSTTDIRRMPSITIPRF